MTLLTPEKLQQIRESMAFTVYEAVIRHLGFALVPMVGYAPAAQVQGGPAVASVGNVRGPAAFYPDAQAAPAARPAPFDVPLPGGGGTVRFTYDASPQKCSNPNCVSCNPPVAPARMFRPAPTPVREMEGMPVVPVGELAIESTEDGTTTHRFFAPSARTANVLCVMLSGDGPADDTAWLTVYMKVTDPATLVEGGPSVAAATLEVPRDLSRVWVSIDEAASTIDVKVSPLPSRDVTLNVFNAAPHVS